MSKKGVDFEENFTPKSKFRVPIQNFNSAISLSKMSIIAICKKVFCAESKSLFDKNIIFYEKTISTLFSLDFVSKFTILGLKKSDSFSVEIDNFF